MIAGKRVNIKVNEYCALRDRQNAVYAKCAKSSGLSTNELFVLDVLWFADDGITQKQILERLSVNKQTLNAVVSRFLKDGYIVLSEVENDKRNKKIYLTEKGKAYCEKIIPPAADAENLAMADLTIDEMDELVRLTAKFTENMENRFGNIR